MNEKLNAFFIEMGVKYPALKKIRIDLTSGKVTLITKQGKYPRKDNDASQEWEEAWRVVYDEVKEGIARLEDRLPDPKVRAFGAISDPLMKLGHEFAVSSYDGQDLVTWGDKSHLAENGHSGSLRNRRGMSEQSDFMALETKMESLVSYVMRSYLREAQNGDTVCKFCYCYQKSSTCESHCDDCPRLAWATEHKDFPCDRAEERMGKTYPNWGVQVDICKRHSSTLTSDGLFMNEFIFGKT